MKQVLRYIAQHRARHLAELAEFLAIPSISTKADHAADVARAAQWTADHLRQIGLERVTVHRTPGHPLVTAESRMWSGRPTVLVYGHFDVQPVDPLGLWKSPPFEATVRGNRLYARGAADDKGQLFIHFKVLEAFHRVRGGLPVNVKMLIEGEEEIGSPNLLPFLERNAKRLSCDVVLVSDTPMLGIRQPSITTSLRGLASFELTVRTAARDMHSGVMGGAVANPIQVLAELLGACKDARTGRVKIPGFYEHVRRLSPVQRRRLAAVPHSDASMMRALGVPALFGEAGYSTAERIGARPTFDVNGIWGGYTGDGMKTVLPCEAHAKVSMRLVADQKPADIASSFRRYLETRTPAHAKVELRQAENSGLPVAVDPDFPLMRFAADAIGQVFGKQPLFTMDGASVPIVADFKRVLGKDTILLGFGLPDDNLHAPNEKIDLRMLDKGMQTVVHFLAALATARKADHRS